MIRVKAFWQSAVVYQAVAHKHVPLMKYSTCEAIKNNITGTYHPAGEHGSEYKGEVYESQIEQLKEEEKEVVLQ